MQPTYQASPLHMERPSRAEPQTIPARFLLIRRTFRISAVANSVNTIAERPPICPFERTTFEFLVHVRTAGLAFQSPGTSPRRDFARRIAFHAKCPDESFSLLPQHAKARLPGLLEESAL